MINNIVYTKKLSYDNNYVRPKKTITEMIQNQEGIEENLKNYEEVPVDDINFITINTHLKYISFDKKKKCEQFRFGGILTKMEREYIVLAGKDGMRFSVQRYTKDDNGNIIHTTRFFKKVKESDVLKNELEHTAEIIEKQNEIIEQQKLELMAMKKKLSKLLK
jgi:hypothetical protein